VLGANSASVSGKMDPKYSNQSSVVILKKPMRGSDPAMLCSRKIF